MTRNKTQNTFTHRILQSHLIKGSLIAGKEVAIKMDQTLTQDATGTMVMLELEAMKLDKVRTEISVQYVDHNILQLDYKNPDDHRFLRSAANKYGLWFSPPGQGISHVVHQDSFGIPGKTLIGADSHTCAAGALGMLAVGSGGLDVAMSMLGGPFYLTMPKIVGVELVGKLSPWVSAKDVILELIRRVGVSGGIGKIFEYFGDGSRELSVMDRHVICNMGAETGATTSLFPVDFRVKEFLESRGRGQDFHEILAEDGLEIKVGKKNFEEVISINLDKIVPLIALPSSPGKVVEVEKVAGTPIYQSYIGSSANPGLGDFAIVAHILNEKRVACNVSLDINPSSRRVLTQMINMGILKNLISSGARLHQTGCNGCIGMGQAPASGQISLRTVPRNFSGRSGTPEDQVYLVSPETAAASALTGVITDPRTLKRDYDHKVRNQDNVPEKIDYNQFESPNDQKKDRDQIVLVKGPNIKSLPKFLPFESQFAIPILLKTGDDISTDEILPAGAEILPYRSNIYQISEFCFRDIDPEYFHNSLAFKERGGHGIVAGKNYGQGSSREHAAMAPRYLGLRVVIAVNFARIHFQNLINFGILPLHFAEENDYQRLGAGDALYFSIGDNNLLGEAPVEVNCHKTSPKSDQISETEPTFKIKLHIQLSRGQCEIVKKGGAINWLQSKNER